MGIDWQVLIVVSADRARRAIYDESFPARLEAVFAGRPRARAAFGQVAAELVLVTFANDWADLPEDPEGRFRWVMAGFPTNTDPEVVIGFAGSQPAAGLIVVTAARAFHH